MISWPLSSYSAFSVRACPIPCAIPPCTCPSTIVGLTIVPKSSTAVYLSSFTSPVSGSISTSAICDPAGNEKFAGSKKDDSFKPGSSPSGSGYLTSSLTPGK